MQKETAPFVGVRRKPEKAIRLGSARRRQGPERRLAGALPPRLPIKRHKHVYPKRVRKKCNLANIRLVLHSWQTGPARFELFPLLVALQVGSSQRNLSRRIHCSPEACLLTRISLGRHAQQLTDINPNIRLGGQL
ncbi:hypothetical protein M514_16487 [Trichuris suis]|uniref:Uncharacterized protein n=1 Tax=Trichuris suis TaxID=68888 RepID=A0A085NNU4_9BILA|nr:hypothetical protein M514_16487 [Trichuris suis]